MNGWGWHLLLLFPIYMKTYTQEMVISYVWEKTPDFIRISSYVYVLSVDAKRTGCNIVYTYYIYNIVRRKFYGKYCMPLLRCTRCMHDTRVMKCALYIVYIILYVEDFTENIVRCAQCAWVVYGFILYLYYTILYVQVVR